jgi:hypothetical protein
LLGLGCPKQAFAKIATPRFFTILFTIRIYRGLKNLHFAKATFPGYSAVAKTIKTTKALIETEASLSLDLKEALDQLLYVTKLMFDRLTA